jgi:thymidylate synthase
MKTLELVPVTITIEKPCERILNVEGRVINFPFAIAEAIWILSGSDDRWIFAYNRDLLKYADDGILKGAYGPRLRHWGASNIDQLDYARTKLLKDCSSRQAVVQIWDPKEDSQPHKDVACTINYRFFIRNGKLNMHSHMRSQDIWLGFPYDMFTITLIQELMAGWLEVEVGRCEHYVDSMHLYQTEQSKAECVGETLNQLPDAPPAKVPWLEFDAMLSDVQTNWMTLTSFWSDCGAVLSSYRAWQANDHTQARTLAISVGAWARSALLRWYDRIAPKCTAKSLSMVDS